MEGQISLFELNQLIRQVLQDAFTDPIWLVAEIGELKVNRTGHCYLELIEKDQNTEEIIARARATIWSWQFRFIQPYFESLTGQQLNAGLKVLVAATVEFHEVYGLSLNIKDIDPGYTLGDLARKRQEIINRLTEDGVIDMNKELDLPDLPGRIAVISSPTAAGYEDFLNQLHGNSRGYRFSTRLFEATMQGQDAAQSIMAALDAIYLEASAFDVVVIIRGGGAQIDLACFDHYELALNVAQFPLPVLTGIGHEKDESITDLVAHTRLKTPTAVAGFLIECFDRVAGQIEEAEDRFRSLVDKLILQKTSQLQAAIRLFKPLVMNRLAKASQQNALLTQSVEPQVTHFLERKRARIVQLNHKLGTQVPVRLSGCSAELQLLQSKLKLNVHLKLQREKQESTGRDTQFRHTVVNLLTNHYHRLDWYKRSVDLLDPVNILKRGFSLTLKDGKIVKNADELQSGERIESRLFQGTLWSVVDHINKPKEKNNEN